MRDHPHDDHAFPTGAPARLYVELGAGRLSVRTAEIDEVRVRLSGVGAPETTVRQEHDQVSIIAPKARGGFLTRGGQQVDAEVVVPADSQLIAQTASADVSVEGPLTLVRAATGSGDVDVDLVQDALDVHTGSGDVHVHTLDGHGQVKCGSGEVRVDTVRAPLTISTGSGDVHVAAAYAALSVKTGSGDLDVTESRQDVSFTTGSGDALLGRVVGGRIVVKGASGDVELRVPPGTPTWTDVRTLSGDVRSDLPATGAPGEGQDHIEVRVTTASGDVTLLPA